MAVVLNFIWIHDPDDLPDSELSLDELFKQEQQLSEAWEAELDDTDVAEQGGIGCEESSCATRRQDEIAFAMWISYQAEVQHCRA